MIEPGKKDKSQDDVFTPVQAELRQPHPGYHMPREAEVSGSGQEGFDPRRLLGLALSYWWMILLFLLLGTGGGVAYILLATPKYRAICRYEIFSEWVLNIGSTSTMEAQTRNIDRQIMLLASESLKSQVRNNLKNVWQSQVGDAFMSPEVVVRRGKPGSVLDMSVTAVNEEYARVFLDELVKVYKETRKVEEMNANTWALNSLRQERDRLSKELQDVRGELATFRAENNIRISAVRRGYEEKFVDNMLGRANSLRLERAMIATQMDSLADADAPTIHDVVALTLEAHTTSAAQAKQDTLGSSRPLNQAGAGDDDNEQSDGGEGFDGGRSGVVGESGSTGVGDASNWAQYEGSLARLEATYEESLKRFKRTHPRMLKMRQQIDQVRNNIFFEREIAKRRLEARSRALEIQENALTNIATAWQGDATMGLDILKQAKFETLLSEVSRLKGLVDQIGNRIIDISSQSSESLITQLVTPPRGVGQVWPKPLPIMGGSVGGALALGVALAFALFYFDSRFLDVIAVEQKLGLPFISGIPRWERVIKDFDPESNIVMDRSKPNAASEAYRSLRISLDSHIQDKKGYSLLISSSDAGEGKSVTCANLGIAFSWGGKKILLVDADLRRPNLHNILEQKNSDNGLTQFLLNEVADWREILRHTEYDNVDFIPAGKFVYEASELCSPARLHEMMKEWSEIYDLIILDSAPVGRIVDTAMIAKGCDGVLLMSLHGKASFPAIRHALRRLEGANVLGFCLNAIDIPRGHHGYYGGYSGYKWRYGLYSYYDYYSRALYGYDNYYNVPESAEAEEEVEVEEQVS